MIGDRHEVTYASTDAQAYTHRISPVDLIFTGLFTVELIITYIAHAGWLFWRDSWRIFDFLIVCISLVSATGLNLPAVKQIRAVRVLRAVRLLRKSKNLRPIVEALFASVAPVLNSMVLLALITAIYASMAVGLFGEDEPVYFGKFSRSMFTMFQVVWAVHVCVCEYVCVCVIVCVCLLSFVRMAAARLSIPTNITFTHSEVRCARGMHGRRP